MGIPTLHNHTIRACMLRPIIRPLTRKQLT